MEELQRIYRTNNSCEAHLICNRLAGEGIRANVVGDMLPYAGMGTAAWIEVWVGRQNAEHARQLLIDWHVVPPPAVAKPVRWQFPLLALLWLTASAATLLANHTTVQVMWAVISSLAFLATILHIVRRSRRSQRKVVDWDDESQGLED